MTKHWWKLTNPRNFVTSASVYFDGERYWLAVHTKHDRPSRPNHMSVHNSMRACKLMLSREFLQPKYHGKNIWRKE